MRHITWSILILMLGLTACAPVSPVASTPSAMPSQTTSPTPTMAQTQSPTETQTPAQAATSPSNQTPSPQISPTLTRSPTQAPAFDISQRVTQPPIKNDYAYLQWMLANTHEGKDYIMSKWDRAQAIIAEKYATDPRVIEAFLRTPREYFFYSINPTRAYASAIYDIGYGQTISGPYLVCHMTEAIAPQPNQKVLEIGTGSGYQSAILSELSNYVYTIEIVPQLAQKADALYTKLTPDYPEYANIKRKNADGYYGWPEYAPFDRIIVTAGIDHVPPELLAQLAPGGIMVIPVGPPSGQTVLKISKVVQPDGSITFVREDIYHGQKIRFVPFTGGHQGQ